MAVQVSYPGVYIEEFTPGAPIQGAGTSTAAFIGPAARGELDSPTRITSWDSFLQRFGEQPLPGFFLWYAVRGFFENGGQDCYIVRASNGDYGEVMLLNENGDPAIRVRALQPGNPTTPIQVQVIRDDDNTLLTGTILFRPPASSIAATGVRELTLTDPAAAAHFRPTDILDVNGEHVELLGVSGATLRLAHDLTTSPAINDTVRLADLPVGTRAVRIQPPNPLPAGVLVSGTMLTIDQGAASATQIVQTVQAEPLQTNPPTTTYRVTFVQGLGVAFSLDPDPANVAAVRSREFELQVAQGTVSATYTNLSIEPAHPRYALNVVNGSDGLVKLEVVEPPPFAPLPDNLPDDTNGLVSLTGGENENLGDMLGDPGNPHYIDTLDTLREIDDVNLIAIPDGTTAAVQQAMIDHCQQMADRFAVLDARPPQSNVGLFDAGGIFSQRLGVESSRGYAALYYPWLRVRPAGPGAPILVPPSGHICGIMARSDNNRGVHKAPANEIVSGAFGVERTLSDIDQGQLNLEGINVIRLFQTGGRPTLWGARTTASDLNWQYVNVRRLFLFLEESIQEGIRWAVFEPNNLQLWQKLKRSLTEFLNRVWRDGALFGATPEEAFYVRIDEVLNPESERALGRLFIEIGIRPSYPAEFIIVRIGIWQGGSVVSEE